MVQIFLFHEDAPLLGDVNFSSSSVTTAGYYGKIKFKVNHHKHSLYEKEKGGKRNNWLMYKSVTSKEDVHICYGPYFCHGYRAVVDL